MQLNYDGGCRPTPQLFDVAGSSARRMTYDARYLNGGATTCSGRWSGRRAAGPCCPSWSWSEATGGPGKAPFNETRATAPSRRARPSAPAEDGRRLLLVAPSAKYNHRRRGSSTTPCFRRASSPRGYATWRRRGAATRRRDSEQATSRGRLGKPANTGPSEVNVIRSSGPRGRGVTRLGDLEPAQTAVANGRAARVHLTRNPAHRPAALA